MPSLVSRKSAEIEMALEVNVSTPQGMLTTKQVCEYIDIAAHTTPVAYRVGSQLRYRREDVEACFPHSFELFSLRKPKQPTSLICPAQPVDLDDHLERNPLRKSVTMLLNS